MPLENAACHGERRNTTHTMSSHITISSNFLAPLVDEESILHGGSRSARRAIPRPRILIVDDDRDFRDLHTTALRGAGYEVESAPDGEAALMKLAFQHFDLAIVEWHMPRLDGASLVFWLRSAGSRTPVVMVTAADISTLPLATARQLSAILPKPVSLTEYLAAVRSALSSAAANGRLNQQVA
jgi:DNA-binding response OmpR family regulator